MKRHSSTHGHSLRHGSSLRYSALGSLAVVLVCALGARTAWASGSPLSLLRSLSQDFFLHGSQGYLGVDLQNASASHSTTSKSTAANGVEIVAVDHDAPAAKAGLRVHDVIVAMNGHPVNDCDELRHMLRKQPPGRIVAFAVNRDGAGINVTVQLADRALLQQRAWSEHYSVQEPPASQQIDGAQTFVQVHSAEGSRFLGTLLPSSLYVGADVSPVRPQLAEYFGVTSGAGLLVESVDSNSPASRAGLRAGDVILKVGDRPMVSRGDWLKAIRNSRGSAVQLTIVRDKQQQTLAITAGPKKKG